MVKQIVLLVGIIIQNKMCPSGSKCSLYYVLLRYLDANFSFTTWRQTYFVDKLLPNTLKSSGEKLNIITVRNQM